MDQPVHRKCAGWKTDCYSCVTAMQYTRYILYASTKDLIQCPYSYRTAGFQESYKNLPIFETFVCLLNLVAVQDCGVLGTWSCKHIHSLEKQTKQITAERNGVNLNKYSRLHVVHGADVMTHMAFLFSFRLCQGINQEKAFCILAWQMKKMIQLYKR